MYHYIFIKTLLFNVPNFYLLLSLVLDFHSSYDILHGFIVRIIE